MSAQLYGLYRTTVTFWTPRPADDLDATALARLATDGHAYCAGQETVLIPCPDTDPAPPDPEFFDTVEKVIILLLCDRCYETATSEEAECQPGCRHRRLDDDGACLWPDGPTQCHWCGATDRLTPVPHDHDGLRNLPTVGERHEGQWWLNWPLKSRGPYPSPNTAWEAWHTSAT